MKSLAVGDKVHLLDFGTFEAKKCEARTGRNPKAKEAIELPTSAAPVFKAGKAFKDALN